MMKPWLDDMLASGIKAAFGIPLVVGSRTLGIMKIYHSEVNGFTLGRLRRLQALASLATTLLEKSVTLQETQAAQARQEELTEALYAISSCTTEDEILITAANAAQRLRMPIWWWFPNPMPANFAIARPPVRWPRRPANWSFHSNQTKRNL